MGNRNLELTVGCFVLIGFVAFLLLSLKVSTLDNLQSGDNYLVTVSFNNIGGLKAKAPVKLSGVSIGWVESIDIDRMDYQAHVTMKISNRYDNLPSDSSARIYTSGLLGEQYVGLSPGGEEAFLGDGDKILISDDALALEDVIGQLLYQKAAGD